MTKPKQDDPIVKPKHKSSADPIVKPELSAAGAEKDPIVKPHDPIVKPHDPIVKPETAKAS